MRASSCGALGSRSTVGRAQSAATEAGGAGAPPRTLSSSTDSRCCSGSSSSPGVCLSPRKAFQQFYKQFVEYTCPTEDIYLE